MRKDVMIASLKPAGRPMLIGSQPLDDHAEATRLVLRYVPEIPNWVQLPVFRHEGMVAQFASGLPGVMLGGERMYVDTAGDRFDEEMIAFFEEYLAVAEQSDRLIESRFALSRDTSAGFFCLLEMLSNRSDTLFAVKGQITGPVTFCTALADQDRRAIFYHDALRDAAVKMLAFKAAWQVRQLGTLGVPVILFIDEPALAGFGSSELISISREDIEYCLQEVIDAVHGQGGLAGVHVCANTDWSLLLDSAVDVVNFDAYGYFDKFVLYAGRIKRFLSAGGCLAWGLVPTSGPDPIAAANVDNLMDQWQRCLQRLAEVGIDAALVRDQSFITPSCGTGSLSTESSHKVLELTQALSRQVRASIGSSD
jgi:methionine synthase II (cobalamin-independent)